MSKHAVHARTGESRANLYDEITDKIIADLEAGRVPWVQPWGTAAARAPLAMPKNASTDRPYSGINLLLLWGAPTRSSDSNPNSCGPAAESPQRANSVGLERDGVRLNRLRIPKSGRF